MDKETLQKLDSQWYSQFNSIERVGLMLCQRVQQPRRRNLKRNLKALRALHRTRDKWIAYWQTKLEIPANKSPQQHLADMRWAMRSHG